MKKGHARGGTSELGVYFVLLFEVELQNNCGNHALHHVFVVL